MKYLTLFATLITSISCVTVPSPTGDLWNLKRDRVVSFDVAWKECEDMKGFLIEIHDYHDLHDAKELILSHMETGTIPPPQGLVWTAAVKRGDSYHWNQTGAPVDFTNLLHLDPLNDVCYEDCCRLILKPNGKVMTVSCKVPEIARGVCTLPTQTRLKKSIEKEKGDRESFQTELTLQLTAHVIEETEARKEMGSKIVLLTQNSTKQESNITSMMTHKKVLYALYGVDVVLLAVIGLSTFLIYKRITRV